MRDTSRPSNSVDLGGGRGLVKNFFLRKLLTLKKKSRLYIVILIRIALFYANTDIHAHCKVYFTFTILTFKLVQNSLFISELFRDLLIKILCFFCDGILSA